jgi:EAL domain-containing protein (putative c-di-GMP-specific phosphodiesterase class I)
VAPDVFIPLAEATGLVVPLGSWALAEGLRQLAAWRRQGIVGPDFSMAVNLAAPQIDHTLVDEVLGCVDRHGLAPADLCLEVTESIAIADADGLAVLAMLRHEGVRVAIDDFGTGHSSLAQLQRMPVDILKVDRAFTAELEQHEQPIAAIVVALARALDLVVVAEGVETDAQLHRLRELGCDRVQGFLLGRPAPAEELAAQVAPAHRPAADPGVDGDRKGA